jgi:hypothetical protein
VVESGEAALKRKRLRPQDSDPMVGASEPITRQETLRTLIIGVDRFRAVELCKVMCAYDPGVGGRSIERRSTASLRTLVRYGLNQLRPWSARDYCEEQQTAFAVGRFGIAEQSAGPANDPAVRVPCEQRAQHHHCLKDHAPQQRPTAPKTGSTLRIKLIA